MVAVGIIVLVFGIIAFFLLMKKALKNFETEKVRRKTLTCYSSHHGKRRYTT